MKLKLATTMQGTSSQNVVSEHVLLALLGILSEMQILKVYTRSTESESWEVGPRKLFSQTFQVTLTMTFKKHSQGDLLVCAP